MSTASSVRCDRRGEKRAPVRRLVVVDQTLSSFGGHNYEYDSALFSAANKAGCEVTIAGGIRFDGAGLPSEMEVWPWFTSATELQSAGAGAVLRRLTGALPWFIREPTRWCWRMLRRRSLIEENPSVEEALPATGRQPNAMFAFELRNFLCELRGGGGTEVFIHTLDLADLAALTSMIVDEGNAPLRDVRFHILLRRTPDEMNSGWPEGQRVEDVLRMLTEAWPRRVRFLSDTQELVEAFSRLSPIRFSLAPVVFRQDWLDACSVEPRQDGRLMVTYLGDARREKGFHLLPSLVQEILLQRRDCCFFSIQTCFNIPGGEPGISEAKCQLAALPCEDVRLIDKALTPLDYYRLLVSSDIVLAPYQDESYRLRSSGVVTQALAAGKPVIVPSDSWMATAGKGHLMRCFDSADDLMSATLALLDEVSQGHSTPAEAVASFRQKHRAARLVEILMSNDVMR